MQLENIPGEYIFACINTLQVPFNTSGKMYMSPKYKGPLLKLSIQDHAVLKSKIFSEFCLEHLLFSLLPQSENYLIDT